MIVAEADVHGSLSEASNAGLRLIAGYIFGDNKGREKLTRVIDLMATLQAPLGLAIWQAQWIA